MSPTLFLGGDREGLEVPWIKKNEIAKDEENKANIK